ncbi:MAG: cell division protein FtsZ [Bacteroidaceae bacterium]|nr:cell division protein FtsZ [Bacteroidaceae bacterium]
MAENKEGFVYNFNQVKDSIIKVIGVGGGGCNAVNHMYNEGIHDVSFVVCNTDNKALKDSPVPNKLQLGSEGLGAGNKPECGRKAAEDSMSDIHQMLSDGTKMVFITAGMGGGTGTGAAPVIAKVAKELGILTVGIVTIPFRWEGNKKIDQALDGVELISENVDALLVINNERLREIYQDLSVLNAFAKADDTLCNAARSIAEIITMHGIINLDFNDVRTVLKDGGVAIMSSGYGRGECRISKAIESALHSPLLNNNDIYHSRKVLLHISFCGDETSESGNNTLMMDEMNEINDFMDKMKTIEDVETKWGLSVDASLGDRVKVTVLATGFGVQNINTPEMNKRVSERLEVDIQREAERREEAMHRQERREQVYGPDRKGGRIHRMIYSYIFRDCDLDNDDLISMVESQPTYKRNKETNKLFSEKSAENA